MSANINTSHTNKTNVPSSCKNFNEFFNSWLERQQVYLDKLVDASSLDSRDEKGELVEKVLLHYEEYYEEKYKVISQDIFRLFSPPWLSTFGMAILWIGGLFKPSLVLGLTRISVLDIEPGQVERLERVRGKVEWMEKKLVDGLAEVQESMGSTTLTELTKNWRKLVDGEASDFEEVIVKLKESLGKVVEEADNLRRYMVDKAVEILNLDQTIKLLVAIAQYQVRIRSLGVKNDIAVRRNSCTHKS